MLMLRPLENHEARNAITANTARFHIMGRTGIPKRIQRRRTKGWRMPAGAVYVGRPTKWGNPFAIGEGGLSAKVAVELYLRHVVEDLRHALPELRGKDLACWCPLDAQYCHADILLTLANDSHSEAPRGH